MDSSSSPETPPRNSDIDFNDVFGGPPRRPTIHETKYRFGKSNTDSSHVFRRSDEPVRRNPWSGLSEKPVFGEEQMSIGQRRRSKSDFFDDIFRGNESSNSSLMSKAEQRNGFQSSYCFGGDNEESTKGNSNEDSRSSDISKNGSKFHFSMHKWANKGGIPAVIPPRGSYRIKEKGKLQRWSSANGRSIGDGPKCKSFGVEHRKNENEDGEPGRIIEEDDVSKSESEIINKLKSTDEATTHKKQETRIKHFPRKSWDNGKARVRGKVKEFIKIFNQDATFKPRTDAALSENHGSSLKERDRVKPENETNIINKRAEILENIHLDNPIVNHMYNGASEENINSSARDAVSDGSNTIVEDPVELFEDNFLIEDLTPEEKTLPQFGFDPEEIKAIDDKIRQWSNEKRSNIRSLLSTLQYVLWPDSGWKPVPLVNIIEGPAVKRSYQKALLCLHPDKLQQKGADSDKKYIAEQVFNILQDAWAHYNSLASV